MKYLKYLNIGVIAVFATLWSACNRDEIFEREQYKHVIALLSEGDANIFAEEHDPAEGDAEGYTEGYIAASCGGALPTAEAVTLTLAEDADLLWQYNNNSFAAESYKYARYLSPSRYRIDHPTIAIPKGERNGRMKIMLNAAGLSPDSAYLIPFRVAQCSAYELNPQKSTVLYRVYVKNFWASAKSVSDYSHRGIKTEAGTGTPVNTMTTKPIVPASGNELRMLAGNKTITEPTVNLIERWAIRLLIADDGKVTIRPWSATTFGMRITQVDNDPEYPNVFKLVDDGYGKTYKTFLLCYDYTDPDDGVTYNMKEELKTVNIITVK